MGIAGIEGLDALQVFDLCVRQLDTERLYVVVEVLDLSATHDREHTWGLRHHVRERDG